MTDYDNRGALWPNKRADKPTSPKYTGSAVIDGEDYYVSAWPGDNSKPNNPVLKFSFTKKQPKEPQRSNDNFDFEDGSSPF